MMYRQIIWRKGHIEILNWKFILMAVSVETEENFEKKYF